MLCRCWIILSIRVTLTCVCIRHSSVPRMYSITVQNNPQLKFSRQHWYWAHKLVCSCSTTSFSALHVVELPLPACQFEPVSPHAPLTSPTNTLLWQTEVWIAFLNMFFSVKQKCEYGVVFHTILYKSVCGNPTSQTELNQFPTILMFDLNIHMQPFLLLLLDDWPTENNTWIKCGRIIIF